MPPGASDAATLFGALRDAARCSQPAPRRDTATADVHAAPLQPVPDLLSRLQGPWSLVFWSASSQVRRPPPVGDNLCRLELRAYGLAQRYVLSSLIWRAQWDKQSIVSALSRRPVFTAPSRQGWASQLNSSRRMMADAPLSLPVPACKQSRLTSMKSVLCLRCRRCGSAATLWDAAACWRTGRTPTTAACCWRRHRTPAPCRATGRCQPLSSISAP